MVPLAGALSITQLPPSERTRSVMAVRPKPLGVAGAMPLPSSLRMRPAWRSAAAVPARGRLLGEIDGERARLAVADGIGDALLNAAIEREVDRLAIGIGQLAEGDGDLRVGVAALEAGDELVEQLGELDPAERARPSFLSSARFSSLRRSVIERISPTRREIISAVRLSGS